MYAITIKGKTTYAAELKYARQINGKWQEVAAEQAQVLFQDGQLCNLRDLPQIAGLPLATINKADEGKVIAGLLNRLQAAVKAIEETQEAMCDFNVENDRGVADLQEALCDLSLEADNNG